jgi:hypothetical protein
MSFGAISSFTQAGTLKRGFICCPFSKRERPNRLMIDTSVFQMSSFVMVGLPFLTDTLPSNRSPYHQTHKPASLVFRWQNRGQIELPLLGLTFHPLD